ncbi:hypothetical protein SAMN02745885_02650 [Carboxydocella sporoproducens DSM 16521]|uniref:CAAX protease self-immunity n=2 Tax=Carboxydocella TaxID=178898 RepID=A0A1T4SF86_9FIRM|nr:MULTISPECIES: hypothetical protein [Carboxydocella]AVX19282.1 hypothetical protein CFE_0065 [Carboxydocella thermautotrophica]SKA26816.1 hypothetical protein SAMN02745885_02650 [Carboxydocella sporoproducens DSM 16521]
MEMMAAALAAVIAWSVNRRTQTESGWRTAILLAPLIEELAKTGFAKILSAQVLPVHLYFGLIEAIYDAWAKPERHLLPALLSLLSHGFFGYLTVKSGILAALFAHFSWNGLIWYMQRRRQNAGNILL